MPLKNTINFHDTIFQKSRDEWYQEAYHNVIIKIMIAGYQQVCERIFLSFSLFFTENYVEQCRSTNIFLCSTAIILIQSCFVLSTEWLENILEEDFFRINKNIKWCEKIDDEFNFKKLRENFFFCELKN